MAVAEPTAAATSTADDYKDYVHTGPGTLAGRFLRQFWQRCTASSRIFAPRAGRCRPG